MSNQKTKYLEYNDDHICHTGHNKAAIFFEEKNYFFFLKRLQEKSCANQIDVVCYGLMPNRYHLLVYLNKGADLLKNMQAFSTSYSKAINTYYHRTGSIFQGTCNGKLIDTDEYFIYLSKYIHLNPATAGIVNKPEDYVFSSYKDFIGKRTSVLVKTDAVLSQFISTDGYIKFINDNDIEHLKKLKEV